MPYKNVPDSLMGFKKSGPNKSFEEQKYPHVQNVKVTIKSTGDTFFDSIKGMNRKHALERGLRNWPGADVEPVGD